MSTKKTTSATVGKTVAESNRKSTANGKGNIVTAAGPSKAAAATKPAAASAKAGTRSPRERVLSHVHIGEVAGEIWHLLAKSDGQSLASIKKSIAAPGELVVASIGWLAREGKLDFVASGKTPKITLKP